MQQQMWFRIIMYAALWQTGILAGLSAQAQRSKPPIQYVNPLIGNAPSTTETAKLHSEADSELKGQTFPAVGVPHGMTTLDSPDTCY
jgi:putative alpha-1,2-mannosidase